MVVVSVIILAAGKSTRFPENKLLQKILVNEVEYTLLEFLVSKYIELRHLSEVIIVVGHEKEKIMENIRFDEVKFVYNRNYEYGMSYSVKAGVRTVIRYADIVAIHPGDVPFTGSNTLAELLDKALELYEQNREFILLPSYKGIKGGHPVIVSRQLIPYILEISEETKGLKGFLNRFSNKKIYLNTNDLGVLYDIDTPDDLLKAEENFGIKWIRSKSTDFQC